MLSSLSLLNDSQHSSMASAASSLTVTTTEASSISIPRPSSSHTQLKNSATTSPSFGSSRPQRDLVREGKENISPPHPNRSTEIGHSHHSEDGSLVVFPEKQLVNTKSFLPTDASSSTQELLRQQELQLRVLQEQVSTHT